MEVARPRQRDVRYLTVTSMRRITTVEDLEAIVGAPPQVILMKTTRTLDDGCRSVLASSSIAGFGYRDPDGNPRTTLVGGAPGFARVLSPTRLSLDLAAGDPGPVAGGGVSFVFLLAGVGETLRLNGVVAQRADSTVEVDLQDAYVHCAKCILRSRLWDGAAPNETTAPRLEVPKEGFGPLADAAVSGFLAASPFAVVSSWDDGGASDTSPKGDPPGFLRVLDDRTLAIPNRKGNRRTDTFHNLLSCDQLSLAAAVPGRDDLLHLRGTAFVTDDPALLSTMALGDKPPTTALIVCVEAAEIRANDAIRDSRIWDPATHDPSGAPDMNRVAMQHMVQNKTSGAKASMTRALSKGLAATPPKLLRRALDAGYQKDLKGEGYDTRS